jgi:PIN domain nuclease of toxin-antitoxin system
VILLLDAHVALWTLEAPDRLGGDTRRTIEDPANDILVSAVSIWELEIKRANGRLRLDVDLLSELAATNIDVLAVSGADATSAARLPLHHRDPFDRMIIAQAGRIGAVVVTRDPAFQAYSVDVLAA